MGNIICGVPVRNTPECFICSKKINTPPYITCVRCNIALHEDCEQSFRKSKGDNWCICPRCDRCGSLGIIVLPTPK